MGNLIWKSYQFYTKGIKAASEKRSRVQQQLHTFYLWKTEFGALCSLENIMYVCFIQKLQWVENAEDKMGKNNEKMHIHV